MKHFMLIFSLLLSPFLHAQNATISGYVYDKQSGEIIQGALIFAASGKYSTTSNAFGYYCLTIDSNKESLLVYASSLSYQTESKQISRLLGQSDIIQHFYLNGGIDIKEVIINSQSIKPEDEINTVTIPLKQIQNLPTLGGEKNILKALQLMPGVSAGAEGSSGIFVRGGTPDQNLILLDGVALYSVNHVGGFFSIFDEQAISDMKLIKGGFPAQYGGRLSSVLDIKMKDGDLYKYKGLFSEGIMATKFAYEGPIVKEKSSFFVSARRCNLDLFSNALIYFSNDPTKAGYTFYDINFKINTKLAAKSRLYFSFYYGIDKIYFNTRESKSNLDDQKYNYSWNNNWGNLLTNLRLNRNLNPKLFANLSISLLNYNFNYQTDLYRSTTNDIKTYENDIGFKSSIHDLNANFYLDYYRSNNYKIKVGTSSTFHTFQPGVLSFYSFNHEKVSEKTIKQNEFSAIENNIFLENKLNLINKFFLNIGFHFSSYTIKGNTFFSPEVRFDFSYKPIPDTKMNIAFSQMTQYVHLLSNSGVGMAYDMWLPSTQLIEPEYARQLSGGISQSTVTNSYSATISAYYKTAENLINFKEGSSFVDASSDWQDRIESFGLGKSYGLEFLIKKNTGDLTAWLAYTLSRNTRKFANLNNGLVYPFRYDRPHDLSVVVSYKISPKLNITANWNFLSGELMTLGESKYAIQNQQLGDSIFQYVEEIAYNYPHKNNYRLPSYHRLDVSVNYKKQKPNGFAVWNFSIYNIYNQKNAYILYFANNKNNELKLNKLTLFPIIPSISYSYQF